jgi:hypothetical protein
MTKHELTIQEIESLFGSEKVANDPHVYQLEKELSDNFTRTLTIEDKIEILKRAEYL